MTDQRVHPAQPGMNGVPPVGPKTMRALRGNSFGAIVMLLLQVGLGMWVNLYGTLPAADHGANPATAIGRAISNGPVGLSIHAVVGLLLVAAAIAALVRSVLARSPVLITATAVGLVAIVAAALSGARFVGHDDDGASFAMALAAAVAIGAYALVLFTSGTDQAANGRS